jgi:hypothetical protein
VVVDAGHGLELAAIGQPDSTHDVHLPQLHRPGSFPAPVAGLGPSAGAGLDEVVADQGAVDAGEPGRVDPDSGKLVSEAALTPIWMAPAQLAQAGLNRSRHLMRAAVGPMGAVGQRV